MRGKASGTSLATSLVALTLLQGCATSKDLRGWDSVDAPASGVVAGSPCADPIYLELSSRALEDLTEREYQMLLLKEEQCMQWQRLQQTETGHRATRNAVVVIAFFGVVLGAVAIAN